MRFGVFGFRFRGFYALRFRVQGFGIRVQGFGVLRFDGRGFRFVWGLKLVG